MILYIILVLALALLVVSIVFKARNRYSDWESGIYGAIFGGGLAVLLWLGVCFTVLAGNTARDIDSNAIEPFPDGSYAQVHNLPSGEYITYIESIDGASITETIDPDDPTPLVVTSGKPKVVEVQDYLDNKWLWPVPLEGGSSYELHVNKGDIVQK